ncbi:MAG: Uma2 family endonuclease [Elainellaceae cyanobacterium]
MLLELRRLTVPPGDRLLLRDVTWAEFEQILDDLGEHRSVRLAYCQGVLELMTPLPEHEAAKEIISDLIKALLEELDIDFWPLGSTTFKNERMVEGIEPDQCFYTQNEAIVRGKDRIDLALDPPPDLAIEVDVTSRTHPDIYASLGVPELWRFEKGNLQIYRLQDGRYQPVVESALMPGQPLNAIIPQYLKQSKIEGRNRTLRAFRAWVQEQIS